MSPIGGYWHPTDGIDINAGSSFNIIGGTAAGQRNVLSGNGLQNDPDGPAGIEISHALVSNIEAIIFGGLIILFLILEPNGLARLWQIAKEKLRLWPFPH